MTTTPGPSNPHANRSTSQDAFLQKTVRTAAKLAGLCVFPLYYAYRVERFRVETVKLELPFAGLPAAFDGVTILHFSDLHYGFHYGPDELSGLVARIRKLDPDMIVFTGDLFDREVLPYADECAEAFRPLTAPLGKWAVMGNHDYYAGRKPAPEAYRRCGFHLLVNRSERICRGGEILQIAGIDDPKYGRPDLAAAFAGLDPGTFTLFLSHQPDMADRARPWRVDLQLSGHSHGGQVRLPLIGEVLTPPGGRKYVQGLFKLSGRETESFIYTNRGVGTTRLPVRLMCRPELTLITLRRKPPN